RNFTLFRYNGPALKPPSPREYLLIPVGSAGDVYPFIGIGLELKRRGHSVLLLTNAYFQSLIERNGLGFAPLGTAEEFQKTLEDPDLWDSHRGFGVVARSGLVPFLRPMYDFIVRNNHPGSMVVVGSLLALGARLAQEKLGVPLVSLHLQPSVF